MLIPLVSNAIDGNFAWNHISTVFYANHIRPEFNCLNELDTFRISRQLRLLGFKRVFLIISTNGKSAEEQKLKWTNSKSKRILTKLFFEPIWIENHKKGVGNVRRIISTLSECREPYACLIFPTGDWFLNDGLHSSLNFKDVKSGFISIADKLNLNLCPVLLSTIFGIMRTRFGKQFKSNPTISKEDRIQDIWQQLVDLQF